MSFEHAYKNTLAGGCSGKELLWRRRNHAARCHMWYVKRQRESFIENGEVVIRFEENIGRSVCVGDR